MVTGSPGVWTVFGAVFAVHGLVGSIMLRLHALHHPGLVTQLPAGFTAGTPLLRHPPVSTASVDVSSIYFGLLESIVPRGLRGKAS